MTTPLLPAAACKGRPLDWWFPSTAGGPGYEKARKICMGCEERSACLELVMREEGTTIHHRHGMYGGLTPPERDRLARGRAVFVSRGRRRAS